MGPKAKPAAGGPAPADAGEVKTLTLKVVGGEAPSNAVLSARLAPFGCNPKKSGETISKETKDFLEKNRLKKIVFTNGCFDILHLGHVEYLNEAKAQGDVLIVAINSDASVRKLKGSDRPINNEHDRAAMLLNLKSVQDFLLRFWISFET